MCVFVHFITFNYVQYYPRYASLNRTSAIYLIGPYMFIMHAFLLNGLYLSLLLGLWKFMSAGSAYHTHTYKYMYAVSTFPVLSLLLWPCFVLWPIRKQWLHYVSTLQQHLSFHLINSGSNIFHVYTRRHQLHSSVKTQSEQFLKLPASCQQGERWLWPVIN